MNVRERFIQIRKQLQLTQSKFAEELQVSIAYVGAIESGKIKSVSKKVLYRIHEKFNVNFNWLLAGNGEMFVQ
ncbi:helix-turn-helix domain-containing protein [Maribellus comscasis]|uniref:Helix-turn-helix domain-containing protein n=1 Tax=Maribellus comscasis TaxID=2681766 RepID=A0A6I6JNV4_9BACT|nr:helix-turn-helix transcriptional regulator [Maribellus comscasis]QGY44131.1 helix-turn-helix domain-containing protein [Maribellus comscasis]